jgi:hypothetical protein
MTEDIIELLIRHEFALSELYEAFAAALPGNADFWNKLVREERAHADVLNMLKKRLPGGTVLIAGGKFRPEAVHNSILYARKQMELTRSSGINIIKALAVAGDLENAAIEKNFFEVFQSDKKAVISDFADLRKHITQA